MSKYLDQIVGYQVQHTAEWRRQKAEQFPNDTRNVVAAEMLERLAEQITALKDSKLEGQISELQDAINDADADANSWMDLAGRVSEELRFIGFHASYDTAEAFLEWYRDLLAEKHHQIHKRTIESRIRRKAQRRGYRVHKARGQVHCNNHGLYMLVDDRNHCVIGADYDADLDEIESYLDEEAHEAAA